MEQNTATIKSSAASDEKEDDFKTTHKEYSHCDVSVDLNLHQTPK